MKHMDYLNFNSASSGWKNHFALTPVSYEGVKINKPRFVSKQGVQLFQYWKC